MHLCEVKLASTVGPSGARGQRWMPRVAAVRGMLIFVMLWVHQLWLGIVLRGGRCLFEMCLSAIVPGPLCFLKPHHAVALRDVH